MRTHFDFVLRFRRIKLPDERIPHRADVTSFQKNVQRITLPDVSLGGKQIETQYGENTLPEIYGEIMQAQELACRTLLLDSKFNACNVSDIQGAKWLVDTLCLTSRLPSENSVEALELLQRAWNQHDVAIHLACFYKRLGHLLYLLYILVGLLIVGLSLQKEDCGNATPRAIQVTLFALSMAGSVVLIADRFFNPMQRGGQLRAGAAQLETILWRFRTRVGQFAVPQQGNAVPKVPDYSLRDSLTSWHEDLTAGTDLLSTALDKKYPSKVYRHGQLSGPLHASGCDDDRHIDDFHSPIEPEQYLALRLDGMIEHYQKKIPLFYNWRCFWELVLALCTVASATLSFLSEYTAYVAIATSLAAGVTSWNARDDLAMRISRYTNAVRSPPRLQLTHPGRATPRAAALSSH